ncbi:hypothetical protein [Nitrospirillum amazonense]|uniref:hypothetical protein n=1 Tax=Nitrospirillum amazonense TaxID=28077 RepID=UPI001648E35E|nr:hypothetical protein [Nitrospirillum amazonense]
MLSDELKPLIESVNSCSDMPELFTVLASCDCVELNVLAAALAALEKPEDPKLFATLVMALMSELRLDCNELHAPGTAPAALLRTPVTALKLLSRFWIPVFI